MVTGSWNNFFEKASRIVKTDTITHNRNVQTETMVPTTLKKLDGMHWPRRTDETAKQPIGKVN